MTIRDSSSYLGFGVLRLWGSSGFGDLRVWGPEYRLLHSACEGSPACIATLLRAIAWALLISSGLLSARLLVANLGSVSTHSTILRYGRARDVIFLVFLIATRSFWQIEGDLADRTAT